ESPSGTISISEAESQPGRKMMGQWRDLDRSARNIKRVEIGVSKFVFKHQPDVPRQPDVYPGQRLYARTVQLVFFSKSPVYVRFDVGNYCSEAHTDIGFKMPEKILPSMPRLPAINNVGQRIIQSM